MYYTESGMFHTKLLIMVSSRAWIEMEGREEGKAFSFLYVSQ